MSKEFSLRILTSEGVQFVGTVASVMLPAVTGFLTVLANHAPIVAMLVEGPVAYTTEGQALQLEIKGGLMEFSENEMVLLL